MRNKNLRTTLLLRRLKRSCARNSIFGFKKQKETIEAYARDIKLIGQKAYPNGNPDLLENILIKMFIHGLRDDKSKERVLLYSPKTLTEAAQYARFSEAAVRIANCSAQTSASTVNSMNYHGNFNKRGRGRGSSNNRGRSFSRLGFRQGTDRGRRRGQPYNLSFGNRNFVSNGRRGNSSSRCQEVCCFNCNKMGHISKNCWSPKRQASRGRGGGQAGRFQNRVSAVGNTLAERQQEEERETAGASGYTSNEINAIPTRGQRASPFHRMRKLCGVPGKITGTLHSQLLVYSGLSVTIIRSDFCKQVHDHTEAVEEEPEDFQRVTRDGLRIVGVTRLNLSLGDVKCKHPVLITEGIAHKFIIGNDFLTEYNCDILNSESVIKFGNARVPYTLFRSIVNLICPVICSVTTTVGPGEEAVFPALLDAAGRYGPGESLLLEPRRDDSLRPIMGARVFINYNSAIVPVAFINLTN